MSTAEFDIHTLLKNDTSLSKRLDDLRYELNLEKENRFNTTKTALINSTTQAPAQDFSAM